GRGIMRPRSGTAASASASASVSSSASASATGQDRSRSVAPAEPAVELVERPQRPDQQIAQVGEEARLTAFDPVADELADPCDDEHADRDPKQPRDPELQPEQAVDH